MDRLNYFYPYESKEAQHEDQLTRAYLSLLKHSFHAFSKFFKYCRDKLALEKKEQSLPLFKHIENDYTIYTQKGNPKIETDYLLSVLITDENIVNDSSISPSARDARYDGLIIFGSKLAMIIENKPISNNVWPEQLKPSRQNLSKGIAIYKNPAILEWKEIIKHLNSLQSISTISDCEKLMIDDFLNFVDKKFPFLNPYDNFSLCKNDKGLINKRISNILKSIVFEPKAIKYRINWGYYIDTPFDQISNIGLILKPDESDENGWHLELQLNFGDSQSQAKSFYRSSPNISKIKKSESLWFEKYFHVSFLSTGLVWFTSNINAEKYIQYWIKNKDSIYQRKKDEVKSFLALLEKNNIIVYNMGEQKEMKTKFFSTKRSTLNICPGFGVIFCIYSKEAMEKDKLGKLVKIISDKIKEGLSIINLDSKKILRKA
jgi:hypothetical protein